MTISRQTGIPFSRLVRAGLEAVMPYLRARFDGFALYEIRPTARELEALAWHRDEAAD